MFREYTVRPRSLRSVRLGALSHWLSVWGGQILDHDQRRVANEVADIIVS